MKCKFCDAELEAENMVCPGCGAVNEQEVTEEEVLTPAVEEGDFSVVEEAEAPEVQVEPVSGLKGWKLALVIGVCTVLCTALVLLVLWGSGLIGGMPANDPTQNVNDPTQSVENATLVDSYTVTDEEAVAAADKVIATMGDLQLNNAQLQIYYWMQVFDFLNTNGIYYFDYTQPLNTQYYSEEDSVTWEQYFVDIAIETWHRYGALYLKGKEAGFELNQAQKDELAALPQQLEGMLETYGAEDVDALIRQDFGAACNAQAYYDYMALYMECLEFFNGEYEKLQPTEQEIVDFYDLHAAEFEELGYIKGEKIVDVRHILIKPETSGLDENSKPISTEEDIENCRLKAQAVLDTWLAGEATEESFAALAQEHTADTGSKADGGLYTDVYRGDMVEEFDAWCFDESRVTGDYGLVKTTFGYHIMYFVQWKESDQWYLAAESNMMAEEANKMVEAAKEKWPVEVNYEDIALGYLDLAD